MLVVKLESGGKVISRMKVVNEDARFFNRRRPGSPLCDYSYETKIRRGFFAPTSRGRLRDHFREQSVWALLENIFKDMDKRGSLNVSEDSKSAAGDWPLAASVELWPNGDESERVEIARMNLTREANGYRYELADPQQSPWALKGSGVLKSHCDHQTNWRLLADVLQDMEQTGVLKACLWNPTQQPG